MCSIRSQVLPVSCIAPSAVYTGRDQIMGFDIYGQYLRPGYCEVHPDVPEEYPCHVCIVEKTGSDGTPISRFQLFSVLHDSKLNASQKGDKIVKLLRQNGVTVL